MKDLFLLCSYWRLFFKLLQIIEAPKLEIKLHAIDTPFIKSFTKTIKSSSSVNNSTNIYIIH